jgi:hypothetical protein
MRENMLSCAGTLAISFFMGLETYKRAYYKKSFLYRLNFDKKSMSTVAPICRSYLDASTSAQEQSRCSTTLLFSDELVTKTH